MIVWVVQYWEARWNTAGAGRDAGAVVAVYAQSDAARAAVDAALARQADPTVGHLDEWAAITDDGGRTFLAYERVYSRRSEIYPAHHYPEFGYRIRPHAVQDA